MPRLVIIWLALASGLLPPVALGRCESRREDYAPRTFLGYACADGCGRHKAGFHWAERRALTHSRPCHSLPRAEADGCAAYVDEGGDAEAAGATWAAENEIAYQSDCLGAGERFFVGCIRQLLQPINTY